MSSIPGDNAACCTIPPAVSDYKPKGTTETIEGTPIYLVGDKASKKAIVVTPDIFGMVPLTQQGCDLLASQGFYVLFPDLLGDQALTEKDIPGLNAARRQQFFAGIGNPMTHVPLLTKLGESLRSDGFSVGSIGYCWGAKLTVLASATGFYSATALVHPSMLTPEDAENCKAAIGLYQSKDEPTDVLEPFIKRAADYKHYTETFHGFAAARANLEDPVHKAAYEDVYKRMAAFFKKHL